MNRLLDYLEPPEDDLVARLVGNINRALSQQFGQKRQDGKKGEFDYDPAHDDTKIELAPESNFPSQQNHISGQNGEHLVPPPPPNLPDRQSGSESVDGPILPPPTFRSSEEREHVKTFNPQKADKQTNTVAVKTDEIKTATVQKAMSDWQSQSRAFSLKIFVSLLVVLLFSGALGYFYLFLRS